MTMMKYFTPKKTFLTATLGVMIVTISAQAELIFKPLPSEQASIIPQNQLPNTTPIAQTLPPAQSGQSGKGGLVYYPLPAENPIQSSQPAKIETVQPLILPPVIPQTPVAIEPTTVQHPQTVPTVPNGQEFYTIPNKQDEFEPLPMPESEPILSKNQPDIIPFPNQPLDTPPNQVKNVIKNEGKMPIKLPKTSVKTQPKQPIPQKTPVMTEKQPIKQEAKQETKQVKQESKQKPVKEKTVPTVKKANVKFADFPAKAYTGKRVTPKISTLKNLNGFYVEALHGSKGEKQFIDTLNKTKPNYAGHYVITSFTCGLNCTASVAYDVKTGDFMELGGGFADCPATDFNPRQKASVTHHVNSRLLIVIGSSSSGSCVAGYFEEKNGNVSLISQKNLMNYVDASKR